MKRILIFSLAYYPSFVSGAEAAIKEITDRIEKEDIEFHLITLLFEKHAPRNDVVGNIIVHRVGFGGGYLSKILFIPLAVLTARRLHKKNSFDALWSVMTYMLFPVVLLKLSGVQVPHVLTLQDGDPYEKVFSRWFIRPVTPILDYGFRNAEVIQVISTFLSDWPRRRGSSAPVVLIHNGANPRDLKETYSPEEVEALKIKLRKKPGDIFLVNTSRLVHQKANDDILRALALLPENIKLILVGSGPDEKMLRELTQELHLTERVMFIGQVDRKEVTNYRMASDIFVCPSRSEGLGNAFLSAMASRRPVVLTQEGGIADYLFDAKRNPGVPTTGFAVDKNSPEQIADAVTFILGNPEKVNVVIDTARKMVEEKYDWDVIAKEMRRSVFEKVF